MILQCMRRIRSSEDIVWQRTGPSLVTFRFLYRSKDFLQAQEIIPNTSDAPHISSSPSQTIRKSRRLISHSR
ncbi:hypothetical protein BD410DRAFT_583994 [Rickenella mellea]|uniref:Uncharacterized protein n=1 Tax=Rickenella mellea TaxID=50990 RepID=A0A4Y7PPN5_9AGAM|nr:hypothetical protein BD410DRAFT_583994 [Rickenella mellea]